MNQTELKKKIISFIEKGLLISPDMLERMPDKIDTKKDIVVLTPEIIENKNNEINWKEFERIKSLYEHGKTEPYNKFLSTIKEQPKLSERKEELNDVEVIFSYQEKSRERSVSDFIALFTARYQTIRKFLQIRPELQNLLSISKVKSKKEKEELSIIGLVAEKQVTKNKNILLKVEDPTGTIAVLVSANKPDLYNEAKTIVEDEVIGVSGVNGNNIVFANNICWPEIPNQELKKAPDESYAIFLSDLHVGSVDFLPDAFERFLQWINGNLGDETQVSIAKKVKYIIIAGDLVDGVGIYPNQDKELTIKDIYEQYEFCASLLKEIPSRIKLIIAPGNHDASRIAEPQPPLPKDYAEPIHKLKNATLVSNPAYVKIAQTKNFPGFTVLIYHGYSFDFYVENVEFLRTMGGYERPDLLMKFLLKRRHLAPTHTSTLYIPEKKFDPLVITKVPDIFVTGHVHKSCATNFKGITLICGSCWQAATAFQKKLGHHPEPARVPIVNLKTRDIKILKFI
ncbi:DNA-directed DNA polymerase II small subunit [Candidatus Woesearchaeota archaeon]|nr:MAG: DNA-directed DNA polymerase II small subunit [Candidatus Woesearchaeota archaeon]